MMNSQDLPQSWEVNAFAKMDVENAESYNIEFSNSKASPGFVLVQHQLSVYQTVDAAKKAFPDWEKQWIPTSEWTTPDDFNFQPKDKSDLFRMACVSGKVDGQPMLFCRYIQQHDNMVTLVLSKLGTNSLTLEQLINALEILDLRLQQN
jgi:hypothetical protein